ncbi:MAG TPA: DoxX family protein [Gemmatimonadaceae bacterium]|nr:DoxX family protein [Gemmatimonadaceae bacterium]
MLFRTRADFGALAGRITLGAIMFPHGLQHAFGLLGGYGFGGTLTWMTETVGFPAPLAALAIVTEVIAPVALVVGLAGRLAALGIIGLMIGAASTHAPNGFFMNWFGTLPPGSEGFEYHLLAIGLGVVVVVNGAGALSVDRLLTTRFGRSYRDDVTRVAPAVTSRGQQAA